MGGPVFYWRLDVSSDLGSVLVAPEDAKRLSGVQSHQQGIGSAALDPASSAG